MCLSRRTVVSMHAHALVSQRSIAWAPGRRSDDVQTHASDTWPSTAHVKAVLPGPPFCYAFRNALDLPSLASRKLRSKSLSRPSLAYGCQSRSMLLHALQPCHRPHVSGLSPTARRASDTTLFRPFPVRVCSVHLPLVTLEPPDARQFPLFFVSSVSPQASIRDAQSPATAVACPSSEGRERLQLVDPVSQEAGRLQLHMLGLSGMTSPISEFLSQADRRELIGAPP